MNPRMVIVVYRPRRGMEEKLRAVVDNHLSVLSSQKLVTDRKPVVMRASDGCIVEVFEWRSADAINAAHTNPAVLALWEEFEAVCEYDKPVNVAEFHQLFSEFDPIN